MTVIQASDFIRLPYTRDLTEGGIAYALHSLPYTYNRMGGSPYERLRRIAAGIAVELAFRRYLTEQKIPFDVKGATPFTDPDRYDVSLGGRRCDIKSFFISRRNQIKEMKQNPQVMLNAPALVPSDQNAAEGHSEKDIYIFAFLAGLTAASLADLQRAAAKQQPLFLVHLMPKPWRRPLEWRPLGRLVFKSESAEGQVVEVSGQVEGGEMRTVSVELPPRRRVQIADDFFSLTHIQSKSLPEARIGIHSPARKETYLIGAAEWGNIWVYGMEIWLAGWLTRAEFNQRAAPLPEGTRVFQYEKTRTKNLAVPVRELKPMPNLFERTKEWSK
ncbi:MAG: hypothetical protein OHK0041_13290 [Anaerolineales bacterium]